MPKISVIIPVYNVEQYLERCLDSVCGQTLEDIEIICINDCSTDNSLEILNKYAKEDNRIKIINFKEKQNAAIARNRGLEIAEGEYLGFVDSDDYIDLDFYEKLYRTAVKDCADIVKGNLLETTVSGELIYGIMNDDIIVSNDKMHFFSEWWTAIYKKTLIDDNNILFPVECPKAHDMVFLARCIIKAKNLSLVDNVCYHYNRRLGSLDQPKLSFESAISAIKACGLICDALNDAQGNEITKGGYLYAYVKRLTRFIYLYFVNESLECKENAVHFLLKYYQTMKYKDSADEFISMVGLDFIFDLLKYNKGEMLVKILSSHKTLEDLYRKNIVFKLRQNIKRNIHNA